MNAKQMIMKRSTIAKTFTIAAVTALALGLAPTAKADDKGCSNATLKGTFAYTASGFITSPPAWPAVRRGRYANLRRKWRYYRHCIVKPKR